MMYCNHEYTNREGRALEKLVTQLEQQLAAAQAELAEIRETGPVMYWRQKTQTVQDGLCEVLLQKVELEKQVLSANERAEQAETQCKRMEGGLREIANTDLWQDQFNAKALSMIRIAKAALEDKP